MPAASAGKGSAPSTPASYCERLQPLLTQAVSSARIGTQMACLDIPGITELGRFGAPGAAEEGTLADCFDEPAEYEGVTYEAGPHEFAVDGRYYADFDRNNPIEGPARGMAWSPTALGLIGQLGVGTVTASTLQMSLGLVAAFAAVGAALLVVGIGLVWVTRAETVKVPAAKPVIVATPA